MADNDEMNKPKPKVGRPRVKPPRAPRKAGGYGGADGTRKYPDNALEGVSAPVTAMTPEQRRIYQAQVQRDYRARLKAAKKASTEVFTPPQPDVSSAALLRLAARPQRVKTDDPEEARRIAGPDAVAVRETKVLLSADLLERTRRAVAALRSRKCDVDASALIEMNLAATLTALEEAFNGGEPFPDVEVPPTKQRPVPTPKKKQEKTNGS